MTITNPTTTQSILDGEITVTDASGEILMGGSNRVQIPEILPGKSQNVTIPMSVKANAAICQHPLDVKLSYRVQGQETQWTETFTVPVTQAIRLEQGGVQLPTAIAGELSDLTPPDEHGQGNTAERSGEAGNGGGPGCPERLGRHHGIRPDQSGEADFHAQAGRRGNPFRYRDHHL